MSEIRRLADYEVKAIGLGCMSMSHAYGIPNRIEAERTLHRALDLGYDFLDTAALYGFGKNEQLLGEVLEKRRQEYVLASKCGLIRGPDGKRSLNAKPEVIIKTCEKSLRNLRTDCIDLYYLHRVDTNVPLEDQIGTLARLVEEGKIKHIGLSEVAVPTIEKAHSIHPIAAVQSEYSLWTRNPENGVLDYCKNNGIAFVAFSPLGRGFLAGATLDTRSFASGDLRLTMPRFSEENLPKNLPLLEPLKKHAAVHNCSLAQIALAWLLGKGQHIIPIPGTQQAGHAEENVGALEIKLSAQEMLELDNGFNPGKVQGERYSAAVLATMET